MKETPFLSVIMPMYNAEKYIDETISSILNQSFEDFELIIVNDQSQDNSESICKKYQQVDSRVKLITVEKNGGAGNARNIGMQMAEGQYIAFMDSDDIIDENLYLKAYQMVTSANLDMVVWGITEKYYDKDGNCYCNNHLRLPEEICHNVDEIKNVIIELEKNTMFGYQWNRFYRTVILKNNNIQFEKVVLYEDYFFNLEVIKHVNTMGILDDTGYYYMKRQNDSITTRYVPEYFELSKRRIESMYQMYEQWNKCDNQVCNILGERYLRYILAGLTKSYDKRANHSYSSRKKWLRSVREEKLYCNTSKSCETDQQILSVFQCLMNNEQWILLAGMGYFVWIVKERLPVFFNKIRRFR